MPETNPHTRFAILVPLLFVVLMAGGFAFARTAWFSQHVDARGNLFDDRFTPQHVDADVLFIGDSALQFGVMPTVVDARSGLRSYNAGVAAPVLATLGDMVVDSYLAHNTRPRLIVLYLSADTDPLKPETKLFDTVGLLLRHAFGTPVMLRFMWQHPWMLYQYPYVAIRLAFEDTQISTRKFFERHNIMAAERGFIPYWLPDEVHSYHPQMTDLCSLPPRPVAPPKDYIAYFRHRYEHDGTRVVFYVAPLADCDKGIDVAARTFKGVAQNTPYTLPHRWFIDDDTHFHLTPEGAAENSVIVGNFVARVANDEAIARELAGTERAATP